MKNELVINKSIDPSYFSKFAVFFFLRHCAARYFNLLSR